MRTPALPLVALATIVALPACGERRQAARPAGPEDPTAVLASVNGVPITRVDLEQRLRKAAAAGAGPHDASQGVAQNALAALVREELLLQEAARLGLDRDEQYQLKLADLQAQVRAFQRKELAGILRRNLQQRAEVTDEEVRAYFEAHAAELRSRFHVQQILYKGDAAAIAQAKRDLDAGVPFETVAAKRFPGAPVGKAPWDLGELAWQQLPPSWRGIVDRLEPGQVSGIIQGDGERAWVVRLVGKTVDPAITFATERERIAERLRQERVEALYAEALEALKGKARIVYAD